MWPFGKKKSSALFDQPRYKNKPVLLLFEYFVLDTIGHLSPARRQGIEQMDLKKIFETRSSDWKQSLKTTLRLSATIDTAILESWYKAKERDAGIIAETFSKEFADEYFHGEKGLDAQIASANATARALRYVAKGDLYRHTTT